MKKIIVMILAGSAALLAQGCTTNAPDDQYSRRVEGTDGRTGNAVKANTVLQMVDPWPEGVEDTNLKVPAERSADGDGEGESASTVTPAATGTTN